jgi:ribosomal protein L11 methyltransferase
MVWIELSMNATDEAIDWISTLLAQRGLGQRHGIEQSDLELRVAASADSDWPFQVQIYLRQTAAVQTQVDQISSLLSPLQRTSLISEPEIYQLDDLPPLPSGAPLRVGRFLISAQELTLQPHLQPQEIALRLPANLAFGYGCHPATRLALGLLETHVAQGMQALDLGSGSGILTVAMAKLGATVLALDNDPVAVQASQNTIQLNQVAATAELGSLGTGSSLGHWMGGDLAPVATVTPQAQFDLIAANILARIHISLADAYRQALRPNGLLITAGFTSEFETEVNLAFGQAGLNCIDSARSREWVALAHRL